MVGFGSEADIDQVAATVRFGPKADVDAQQSPRQFWATSRLHLLCWCCPRPYPLRTPFVASAAGCRRMRSTETCIVGGLTNKFDAVRKSPDSRKNEESRASQ